MIEKKNQILIYRDIKYDTRNTKYSAIHTNKLKEIKKDVKICTIYLLQKQQLSLKILYFLTFWSQT